MTMWIAQARSDRNGGQANFISVHATREEALTRLERYCREQWADRFPDIPIAEFEAEEHAHVPEFFLDRMDEPGDYAGVDEAETEVAQLLRALAGVAEHG